MTKREIVRLALQHQRPPYVPWSFGFTQEAYHKLRGHFGERTDRVLDNHVMHVGPDQGWRDLGGGKASDIYGVVWDRSIDKDIGVVSGQVLPEPTLRDLRLPDPIDPRRYQHIPGQIARNPDPFRVFSIGFSLYERAWTLRGMDHLMMDFIEHPAFVHELLNTIADNNLAMVEKGLEYDVDAVYFGDDWGQQHGLQMGPGLWREFILPVLKRMYGYVRSRGKYVFIHSCGDVDELFDDLIEAGVNCFNPFQPEVMDVWSLFRKYKGRLTFHGGLSTQRTLPYGTPADVRNETARLLEAGSDGGYILAPAHAVEGDVPLENMLAFIEVARQQPGVARDD